MGGGVLSCHMGGRREWKRAWWLFSRGKKAPDKYSEEHARAEGYSSERIQQLWEEKKEVVKWETETGVGRPIRRTKRTGRC